MTPKWIDKNAIMTVSHALYPEYFEILPTTGVANQRALKIQLVVPQLLKSTDSVTVSLNVAMDVSYASNNDHDPNIGISDGKYFIGFHPTDSSTHPCIIVEGDISTTVFSLTNYNNGPAVGSTARYSSEIKIQLKPAEQWGSCHTEHDGGYTNGGNYQHLLDPSNGLYFEIYYNHANEKYRIKYIVVDIDLDYLIIV